MALLLRKDHYFFFLQFPFIIFVGVSKGRGNKCFTNIYTWHGYDFSLLYWFQMTQCSLPLWQPLMKSASTITIWRMLTTILALDLYVIMYPKLYCLTRIELYLFQIILKKFRQPMPKMQCPYSLFGKFVVLDETTLTKIGVKKPYGLIFINKSCWILL